MTPAEPKAERVTARCRAYNPPFQEVCIGDDNLCNFHADALEQQLDAANAALVEAREETEKCRLALADLFGTLDNHETAIIADFNNVGPFRDRLNVALRNARALLAGGKEKT